MSDTGENTLVGRLRARMIARGLNPYRLAKEAGLGADAVRDVLRGKVVNPSGKNLLALADVLGCTVADLYGAGAPALTLDAPLPQIPENPAIRTDGNRVSLDIKANVSLGVAAQILALIEGDKP